MGLSCLLHLTPCLSVCGTVLCLAQIVITEPSVHYWPDTVRNSSKNTIWVLYSQRTQFGLHIHKEHNLVFICQDEVFLVGSIQGTVPHLTPGPLLLAPYSWPLIPGPLLLAPYSWPLTPGPLLLALYSWPLTPGPLLQTGHLLLTSYSWPPYSWHDSTTLPLAGYSTS